MFLSGYEKRWEKEKLFAWELQKGVKPNLEYEIYIHISHLTLTFEYDESQQFFA